jgi:hypothetical protein
VVSGNDASGEEVETITHDDRLAAVLREELRRKNLSSNAAVAAVPTRSFL